MLICKDVLSKAECQQMLRDVRNVAWKDGFTHLDKSHKNNAEHVHKEHAEYVIAKVRQHPEIFQKAFLKHMTFPRFNKYETGQKYSRHVDYFLQEGIRTDWSMTLFLTEPDEYEGGELLFDNERVKLPAGSMVLYESSKVHSVSPVTSGERIAVIAWAQSYIEDAQDRAILGKLAEVLAKPIGTASSTPEEIEERKEEMVNLSFVYNNLLRKWSNF
ncbi:MAG: Fe2+-dependent dioxygenase [Pseudohongiellaceae bacterium]